MASRKQMEQFNKKVESYLISVEAKKVYDGVMGNVIYEVDTRAGMMEIILRQPAAGSLFCIFVRFLDLDRAKQTLPNYFGEFGIGRTGKWNIFEDNEESALNCLEYRIEKTKKTQHDKERTKVNDCAGL